MSISRRPDVLTRPQRLLRREDLLSFLGLFGLLMASQLLAQQGTSALQWCLTRAGVWSLPWAPVIAGGSLSAIVLGGCLLGRANPRPGPIAQTGFAVLAFITLVLSNAVPGWCAEAFGLDQSPFGVSVCWFLALAAIWTVLWFWMPPLVQHWFGTPVNLATADAPPPPPAEPVTLIALVSRERTGFAMEPGSHTATVRKSQGGDATLGFKSLTNDIENLHDPKWHWPWQQLLRAVRRYAPRRGLKIVLVGSDTSSDGQLGSHEQLETVAALLRNYPELKGVTVEVCSTRLDFENFNQVKDEIRRCIRDECKRVPETNVFVDITGGQKVASAAAAAATIGTNGRFQYVRTNEPWDVLVSDLHPQTVPSAGT